MDTVASRRMLASVRALGASVQHVGATLRVTFVDDPLGEVDDAGEPFERAMLRPDRTARLLALAAPDDAALVRVLTPHVLREHLRLGDPIVFVAPQSLVWDPLVGWAPGLGLVPRFLDGRTGPGGARRWSSGYREDLVSVSPGCDEFVGWWSERLVDDVLAERSSGGWLDAAAATFDHVDQRDPGTGVDASNAVERGFGGDSLVSGRGALRTFHFPGFDPARPHLVAADEAGPPPVLLSEHKGLRALFADYGRRLLAAGHDVERQQLYTWDRLPSGLAVDSPTRLVYREVMVAARRDEGEDPPDPFDPAEYPRFVEFLNEPDPQVAGIYSRYLWALYRTRPGLTVSFPDPGGVDRGAYVDWLHRFGRSSESISAIIELPRHPARAMRERPPSTPGVNLAGYLRADLGLGEAARRIGDGLRSASVPVDEVAYGRTHSRQAAAPESASEFGTHDINLVCVTADQFPVFHRDMGPPFFDGRYTIGYWWWEISAFPAAHLASLDLIDELWVGTEHVRSAIAGLTDKPVHVMPISLVPPQPSSRDKASFGLADRFTFLVAFDFFSVMERKNPLGALDAFRRAFGRGEGPVLVMKTINGEQRLDALEQLRCAVADEPDVVMLDGYLSAEDHAALIASCDCYVSLHRAEGLGLMLAEAMALGKPVIATAYSGNLDFMDESNSLLVPWAPQPIPVGLDVYPPGTTWADPDLDAAARSMRLVVGDSAAAARYGVQARAAIHERWTPVHCGARMRARLEEVWSRGSVQRIGVGS